MLQYFFLSAFSWMLCEGVLLYLMLVVVFSPLKKKWWFFMLLGWGIPSLLILQLMHTICLFVCCRYSSAICCDWTGVWTQSIRRQRQQWKTSIVSNCQRRYTPYIKCFMYIVAGSLLQKDHMLYGHLLLQ